MAIVLFGQFFMLNLVLAVLLESCAMETRQGEFVAKRFRVLLKKLSHHSMIREAFTIWIKHDPQTVMPLLTPKREKHKPGVMQLLTLSPSSVSLNSGSPNSSPSSALHTLQALTGDRIQTDFEKFCESLYHNKKYKTCVMTFIVLSCFVLMANTNQENNPSLFWFVVGFNGVSTLVFVVDFFVVATVVGLWHPKHPDKYDCVKDSPMHCLDLLIVIGMVVDLTTLGFEAPKGLTAGLALLLCLRPLRILVRVKEIMGLLGVLKTALTELGLTFVFTLFLSVCFAILGQQLFSGTFHTCVDPEDGELIEATNGLPWETCDKDGTCYDTCEKYHGIVAHPRYSFDNIADGIFSVFILMTMEGFMDMLYEGIAATEPRYYPIPGNNVFASLYFILAIVVFAFFFIQLFLGVVYEAFVAFRSQDDSGGVVSDEVRADNLCLAQIKKIMPPKLTFWDRKSSAEKLLYRVVYSPKFEGFIMSILSLNAAVLCLQFEGAPAGLVRFEEYGNIVFCSIYAIEMLMKLGVYGHCAYWSTPSDAADGFITISGIVDTAMYCADCRTVTIIRGLRSLRVIRILRLLLSIKSLGVVVRAVMAPWRTVCLITLLLIVTIYM
jgi:hypothetical protein